MHKFVNYEKNFHKTIENYFYMCYNKNAKYRKM